MPRSRALTLTLVGEDGLTPQQKIYTLERSKGATMVEAARCAKVARQTAWQWEKIPAVQDRVNELQQQVQDDVLRIFRASARLAAQRIVECIAPGPASMTAVAAINLKAAEMTLKYAGLEPVQKQQVEGTVRQTYIIERAVYEADVVPVVPSDQGALDPGRG